MEKSDKKKCKITYFLKQNLEVKMTRFSKRIEYMLVKGHIFFLYVIYKAECKLVHNSYILWFVVYHRSSPYIFGFFSGVFCLASTLFGISISTILTGQSHIMDDFSAITCLTIYSSLYVRGANLYRTIYAYGQFGSVAQNNQINAGIHKNSKQANN